jgi:hypothetical protein
MKPIGMHFPSKLDENIELLAKNNRFSEIEKGTLLLNSMAVHDELTDNERKYGESVAAGWMRQRAEDTNDSAQLRQHYGELRAAQINGIPTSMLNQREGFDEGDSRFDAKSILLKSVGAFTSPGHKCRDCNFISKSGSSDECFEHTQRTLHTKGFDLVK